jgi:hypothetical protein
MIRDNAAIAGDAKMDNPSERTVRRPAHRVTP